MKRAQITEDHVSRTALDRLTGADRSQPAPPRREQAVQPRVTMIKLSVFLNREEDAYLESLAAAAKFSGGTKLSKTKLVEAMVRAFSQSRLDVSGVRSEEELLARVTAQLR